MARRSGPTLYEAMSKSAAAGSTSMSTGRRSAASETDRPASSVLLTPGSMVRLPVGYVWVLIVAVGASIVGAFLIGHGRGVEAGRSEMREVLVATDRAAQETSRLREPEAAVPRTAEPPAAEALPTSPRPKASASAARGDLPPPPPGGPMQVAGVTPPALLLDRRESGNRYWVLIATKHEDALATARVVRQEVFDLGLDAQVVPSDNSRLSTVILLPGYDVSSLTDEERRNWLERIRILRSRVVGKLTFKEQQPFNDAYPLPHP